MACPRPHSWRRPPPLRCPRLASVAGRGSTPHAGERTPPFRVSDMRDRIALQRPLYTRNQPHRLSDAHADLRSVLGHIVRVKRELDIARFSSAKMNALDAAEVARNFIA